MSLSSNFPTAMPGLNLDFINATSLDPRITFTRALNTATYFNSAGVLTTANANVPRFDYDPVTLAPRGLLIEEQRTNLLTYSEQFDNAVWVRSNVTPIPNTTTAPDGTTTADTFVESTDAALAGHYVYQSPTLAAGQSYTLTCYAKAISSTRLFQLYVRDSASTIFASSTFNLTTGTIYIVAAGTSSITNVGNGWYRLTVTGTAGAAGVGLLLLSSKSLSGLDYIGDGSSVAYFWGAQLEAGSFATSYIPTTTTALTRNADVASVNTLTPWYNASEGTLFAEGSVGYTVPGTSFPLLASLNDGTANNRIETGYLTSTLAGFEVAVGGVTQANIYPATVAVTRKVAATYKANDFAACVNGGAVGTDTSGSIPVVDRLRIGDRTVGNNLNGHLRRITYYPTRLSNALLQTLTGS